MHSKRRLRHHRTWKRILGLVEGWSEEGPEKFTGRSYGVGVGLASFRTSALPEMGTLIGRLLRIDAQV